MNINKLTPCSIVNDGDIRFMVPLYQRLFAWTDREVSGLLNDLRSHFEQWPDADSSDIHFPYYLGVVTTIPDNGRFCLVDGQQRLTVLMIMASAFSSVSSGWKAFFDNGERLELFAREEDTKYLKSLGRDARPGENTNVLMHDAYKAITDFLSNMDEPGRKFFVDSCFSRINVFNSVLPGNYLTEPASLNKYFEIMNSAGVNLEQHEILKVLLLKGQADQAKLLRIWNLCADFSTPILKKKEDVGLAEYSDKYLKLFTLPTDQALATVAEYNNRSIDKENGTEKYLTIAEIDASPQEFDNPFAERNERSVVTFPEFLLLTLDIYKNLRGEWSFYKTDKLNKTFKENLRQEEVAGFYDLLLKLRTALDLFVIRRKIDGQDSRYELILHDENCKKENECLEQYEAMLSVSSPYYKWLKELLIYVINPENDLSPRGILLELKKRDNAEHPYPAADSLTYEKIDRYWLWRLDYYLWEKTAYPEEKEEDSEYNCSMQPYRQAVREYIFRANRSIEHLHPQNQANNDLWDRADIDSFGNLAMISQSFNSVQSNEDVHVKFSRIESQARSKALQSIKLLRMYVSVKGNSDGWTQEAAKRHEEEMMKILYDSYSQ